MAELPLDQGITRFKQNEDRFDRFTNGSDTQTFTTSGGSAVPTIRKFLKDKDADINVGAESILSQSESARDDAIAAATSSATARDSSIGAAADSATARDKSQAWSEGTLPGGSGTKSAKEWAEQAEATAGSIVLPSLSTSNPYDLLRVKSDKSGYEFIHGYVCDTIAEMKAIVAPANIKSVSVIENGKEGVFDWKTGDYSTQVSNDPAEGRFVKATAISASTGCWVRRVKGLDDVRWYSAVGDGTTDNLLALTRAFLVAKLYGCGLYFPKGTWVINCAASTVMWDFLNAQMGFTLEGDGLDLSVISLTNVASASGSPAWNWIYTGTPISGLSPQYDKVVKGLSIRSSHNGPTLVCGANDLSSSFETSYFERVAIINSYPTNAVSEGLRLNYVLGCTFVNCRFGCYADGSGNNYGVALRMRQASFNTFLNTDFGNAYRGIDFTDFGSYGNKFIGGGSENVAYHFSIRSATATRNYFDVGRASLWTIYAIYASGGSDNEFGNIAYNNGTGPSTVIDPSNCTGVVIRDGRSAATPSMAGSGTNVTNTTGKPVMVRIGGGAYTVVSINGFGMSKASNGDWTHWYLPPGGTISVTYSSTPSWSWQSMW